MPKVETFNRDEVLNQATKVFHDKGFNATSMQDLVDATGLNRSSIYNSFNNKVNLFIECLRLYEDNFNRNTAERLLNSRNGLDAIRQIFKLSLNEIVVNKDTKGCLIVNCKSEMANHEESITSFLNSNQKKTLSLLEDLVSQGQQDKTINYNQSSKEYALYLYAALQGFRMTGILISDKKQLESIIRSVLQILI
jgi:TetR/AcrR family transcriptional repressor of nem operon